MPTRQAPLFNNEVNAYDDSQPGNQVYRERLSVDHDQKLYGNVTDLTINSNILAWTTGWSRRSRPAACSSTWSRTISSTTTSSILVNPDRGLYGQQQTKPFLYPRRQCLAGVTKIA